MKIYGTVRPTHGGLKKAVKLDYWRPRDKTFMSRFGQKRIRCFSQSKIRLSKFGIKLKLVRFKKLRKV